MKYYLIAGESSGDLYGANLMEAIKSKDKTAEFRFWGGDRMQKVDTEIVKHYSETSYMGFVEVLKHLPKILSLLKFCKRDVKKYKPDVLILIDYPGFNLRIAGWAKQQNIKVYYYISPQIWAWKSSRIKQIKRDVDRMYVILPFEKAFYAKHHMPVHYFGHPLKKHIEGFRTNTRDIPDNCIACLPGSRAQEIKAHLPHIIHLAKQYPSEQFVIAASRHVDASIYQIDTLSNVHLFFDRTYDIFSNAKAGIISSGTATLEACLFKVPQVVIYKGNPISYQIAKKLVKVNYISLVNLLANKAIVDELIQANLKAETLKASFEKLLDPKQRKQMLDAYLEVKDSLGDDNSSDLIAADIIETLIKEKS